jgi:hypothetical protein
MRDSHAEELLFGFSIAGTAVCLSTIEKPRWRPFLGRVSASVSIAHARHGSSSSRGSEEFSSSPHRVKILFDECVPLHFFTASRSTIPIQRARFKGKKNGELLRAAHDAYDVLLTVCQLMSD